MDNKIIVIGAGRSGKTYFSTKKLWARFKRPMAYDVNNDYSKLKKGIAYKPQYATAEIMDFIRGFLKIDKKKKIDALFFDDCDAYIDYELMNNSLFRDLVIRHRNPKYKTSIVFIGKRIQNIPTKITEGAHEYYIFYTEGVNAKKRLQEIDERIPELLEKLKSYEYIYKKEGEAPVIKKPVK